MDLEETVNFCREEAETKKAIAALEVCEICGRVCDSAPCKYGQLCAMCRENLKGRIE